MVRKIIPYDKSLKEKARFLRNNMTPDEVHLWKYLKGKQFLNLDFHRQKPIDKYIVDFFCNELMLAVAIDGITHDDKKYDYDISRQKRLETLGIHFLRFTEYEATHKIQNILDSIEYWISENS